MFGEYVEFEGFDVCEWTGSSEAGDFIYRSARACPDDDALASDATLAAVGQVDFQKFGPDEVAVPENERGA